MSTVTIRQHFQRILNRSKHVTVALVVVIVLCLSLLDPHLTRAQNALAALLIGLAIGGAVLVTLRRRFLCPRCGVDLLKLRGQEMRREDLVRSALSGKRRQFWEVWDACPKCGVSFDEERGPIP